MRSETEPPPLAVLALHIGIVAALVLEVAYCAIEVMIVLQPAGVVGPLWFHSTTIPTELLVARRLYAIEGWLAFVGLAIYLALTEIRPRLGR